MLQYIEDQRIKQQKKLPTSTGSKIALFFFILIVVTILFHFFWKPTESRPVKGGANYSEDTSYLTKMNQDVYVGLPEF